MPKAIITTSDAAISVTSALLFVMNFSDFILDVLKLALNPKLNQQDGIHPNKDGTMVMSKTLQKSIINNIK